MVQAAATPVSQKPGDNVTRLGNDQGAYTVRAECVISVGDPCTVYFPHHDDNESYHGYRHYHGQTAVVEALREQSIDIRMTSGLSKDAVIAGVWPINLVFAGLYMRK